MHTHIQCGSDLDHICWGKKGVPSSNPRYVSNKSTEAETLNMWKKDIQIRRSFPFLLPRRIEMSRKKNPRIKKDSD